MRPALLAGIEAQTALKSSFHGLPVSVSLTGEAGRLRVKGLPGTPYARVCVYVRREDAIQLALELPAHLAVPPVWEVIGLRGPFWAAGYLAARRVCLGRDFTPARNIDVITLHGIPPRGRERGAFLAGVRAYLTALHQRLSHAQAS